MGWLRDGGKHMGARREFSTRAANDPSMENGRLYQISAQEQTQIRAINFPEIIQTNHFLLETPLQFYPTRSRLYLLHNQSTSFQNYLFWPFALQ
jgi:hypothetical protein